MTVLSAPTREDQASVERMRAMLVERVGYELPLDFQSFMVRQARAVVRELGLDSLQELAAALDREPDGSRTWIRFISRMTIGESYLFRNPNHMELLRRLILPRLLELSRQRQVTLWSAGCARGEEPYTLAIMLHELDAEVASRPIRIVATDIDADALEAARQATYGAWAFRQTPYHIQRKYFAKVRDRLVLHPSVAGLVSFGYHHIALDRDLPIFPSDGFDLVLCRNVLMYFRHDFRERAGRALAHRLRPEGMLLPGQVERIDGADDMLDRLFVRGSAVYFPHTGAQTLHGVFDAWLRRERLDPLSAALDTRPSAGPRPPREEVPPPLATRRRATAPSIPSALRAAAAATRAAAPASAGTTRTTTLSTRGDPRTLTSTRRPASPQPATPLPPPCVDESADEVLPSGELDAMANALDTTQPASTTAGVERRDKTVVDEVSRRLDALTASELYDTVRALVSAGELDAARERCLALIQQEPLDARHHCLLALVLLEHENAAAAIDALRRAVYCDPDSLTAYYIWWLIGVRYHGASWERTQWARRHLVRLTAGVPDTFDVPLVGRVTAGDIRYLLQRDWHSF